MNKFNIFRIESMCYAHFDTRAGMGPFWYTNLYFRDIKKSGADPDPKMAKLREVGLKYEDDCKIRDKYVGKTLPIQYITRSKVPPASWRLKRPGVWEDPYLRDAAFNILKRKTKLFIFGTRDLETLNEWLGNDPEYKQALADCGFWVRRYQCSRVHHGLRQSIAELDGDICKTSDCYDINTMRDYYEKWKQQ